VVLTHPPLCSCDGCHTLFPASELNFSAALKILVCEKCELILAPDAPPATGADAGNVPLPPAALTAPPSAAGSSAAALVTSMEPGSARRAAAAVLAAVAPGGLPLSDVLRRALALGLFTPQPPAAGGAADVAAWSEMSGALISDDAFIKLSKACLRCAPSCLAARRPQPQQFKQLKQQ
jgi:hypothetical protein